MRKGRPEIQKQKEIKKNIVTLFTLGYSPSYIIDKTKYDKKTVYKYIHEAIDGISNDKDALEKTKLAIHQTVLSFDKLIEMNLDLLAQTDKAIKTENSKSKVN
ncbi:hypothetical protein NsoK4_06895 [Nitrosopumilus sp. K4]|uniref:hypothetical protein n=1 Tax=Nitrosopumilus sp. K4 TaxID=2795383 RepID=UPI001BA88F11|nr:hypothetical protein [Nitrosopumilus sp. K4]QUC64167.1 hypothetical protein NsoK4_06895 [Nitrosopumilus sp. K4]